MRHLRHLLLLPILAVVGASSLIATDRTNWAEDAATAFALIERHHPEPFRRTPRATFEARLAELKERIPNLTWTQYVAAMREFVGLVGDGHTSFKAPPMMTEGFTAAFPLSVQRFSDGYFAVRVGRGYEALLGRRIVTVNGRPIAEVVTALGRLNGGDNLHHEHHYGMFCLAFPGLLHGAGLAASPEDDLLLHTVDAQGVPAEHRISSAPLRQQPDWVDAHTALGATGQPPRYLTERRNITVEHLPDRRAVYVLYQAVRNGDVLIADAARQLREILATQPVERVVFDLRGNEGGSNNLNQPLIHALFRGFPFDQPGRLYVLTGPMTNSAALNFCSVLERETQALFVGEPTGCAPNHSGDPEPHQLAHPRLILHVSTLRWWDSHPADARRFIQPDLPAVPTFADYLAGRDTALELAFTHRPDPAEKILPPNARWERASQAPARP